MFEGVWVRASCSVSGRYGQATVTTFTDNTCQTGAYQILPSSLGQAGFCNVNNFNIPGASSFYSCSPS